MSGIFLQTKGKKWGLKTLGLKTILAWHRCVFTLCLALNQVLYLLYRGKQDSVKQLAFNAAAFLQETSLKAVSVIKTAVRAEEQIT